MATITINTEVIESKGWNVGEFLLVTLCANDINIMQARKSLIDKGMAFGVPDPGNPNPYNIQIPKTTYAQYDDIILASEKASPKDMSNEELLSLAAKLKEIYPKGKNQGGYPWADGVELIAKRLKSFFKKYGRHTSEEIIDATQRYVNDMEGRTDMRLLKYFMFKDGRNRATGEVEYTSDLLTYIENKDEVDNNNEAAFLIM